MNMDDTNDTSEVDQHDGEAFQNNVDPILASLVVVANKGTFEASVTLHVNGAVVTGLLTGIRSWTQAAQQDYADVDVAAQLYAVWEPEEDWDPEALTPRHIHLKDAKTVFGTTAVPSLGRPFYWRGRLASVDGWSLGGMSVQRD